MNLKSKIKTKDSNNNQRGQLAEQQANRYLQQQGLVLCDKNFRCRSGEIDLIMRDGDCLVFIEVRYRKSSTFGGAAASVDQKKQHKIRQSAESYLQQKQLNTACRFDVIAMSQEKIEWFRGAF
ncbi:YraN family protein [Agaribacterium haliotis]|uniref:YraN family protein n=1 Tax=Agaribacterium haliotis TaxID=2013869 RepID=UPI00195EF8DD|nr:YraN family protein [Agaribacterium haliotis]